jgi:hypothetical protein
VYLSINALKTETQTGLKVTDKPCVDDPTSLSCELKKACVNKKSKECTATTKKVKAALKKVTKHLKKVDKLAKAVKTSQKNLKKCQKKTPGKCAKIEKRLAKREGSLKKAKAQLKKKGWKKPYTLYRRRQVIRLRKRVAKLTKQAAKLTAKVAAEKDAKKKATEQAKLDKINARLAKRQAQLKTVLEDSPVAAETLANLGLKLSQESFFNSVVGAKGKDGKAKKKKACDHKCRLEKHVAHIAGSKLKPKNKDILSKSASKLLETLKTSKASSPKYLASLKKHVKKLAKILNKRKGFPKLNADLKAFKKHLKKHKKDAKKKKF